MWIVYFRPMRLKLLIFTLFLCPLLGLSQADSLVVGTVAAVNQEVDSLISFARQHLGKKYGNRPGSTQSFDCSGFVCHVYKNFDVHLPHGSGSQSTVCDRIDLLEAQPGDLLFFSGHKVSRKNIGHVALVTYNDGKETRMIHSTVHAGVIEEVYQHSEYFTHRFIMAGRIRR